MTPMNTAPAAASAQIHQTPFEAETRAKTSLPARVSKTKRFPLYSPVIAPPNRVQSVISTMERQSEIWLPEPAIPPTRS